MKKLVVHPLVCAILFVTASCVQLDEQADPDSRDPGTEESASSGKAGETNLSGYDYYVNHYSNHWPSRYEISVPFGAPGAGVHFYARWKWYQGYGSRTVCLVSSSCNWGVGTCAQEFNLPYHNCSYIFDVDGPYQMQAKVGWYVNYQPTDWWTY